MKLGLKANFAPDLAMTDWGKTAGWRAIPASAVAKPSPNLSTAGPV